MKIFTIGHSNRDFLSFVNLLLENRIEVLVDVRRFPKSRFEHFNADSLRTLCEYGIEYIQKPELGGFRRRIFQDSPNKAIKSIGFRNYADFMLTEEFENSVKDLIVIAMKKTTAIMCAEKFFWKCHRKFIADYLTVRGFKVLHIIDGKILIHKLSKNVRVREGKLIYDVDL